MKNEKLYSNNIDMELGDEIINFYSSKLNKFRDRSVQKPIMDYITFIKIQGYKPSESFVSYIKNQRQKTLKSGNIFKRIIINPFLRIKWYFEDVKLNKEFSNFKDWKKGTLL